MPPRACSASGSSQARSEVDRLSAAEATFAVEIARLGRYLPALSDERRGVGVAGRHCSASSPGSRPEGQAGAGVRPTSRERFRQAAKPLRNAPVPASLAPVKVGGALADLRALDYGDGASRRRCGMAERADAPDARPGVRTRRCRQRKRGREDGRLSRSTGRRGGSRVSGSRSHRSGRGSIARSIRLVTSGYRHGPTGELAGCCLTGGGRRFSVRPLRRLGVRQCGFDKRIWGKETHGFGRASPPGTVEPRSASVPLGFGWRSWSSASSRSGRCTWRRSSARSGCPRFRAPTPYRRSFFPRSASRRWRCPSCSRRRPCPSRPAPRPLLPDEREAFRPDEAGDTPADRLEAGQDPGRREQLWPVGQRLGRCASTRHSGRIPLQTFPLSVMTPASRWRSRLPDRREASARRLRLLPGSDNATPASAGRPTRGPPSPPVSGEATDPTYGDHLTAASAPGADLSPVTLSSDAANAALAQAVGEWTAIRSRTRTSAR